MNRFFRLSTMTCLLAVSSALSPSKTLAKDAAPYSGFGISILGGGQMSHIKFSTTNGAIERSTAAPQGIQAGLKLVYFTTINALHLGFGAGFLKDWSSSANTERAPVGGGDVVDQHFKHRKPYSFFVAPEIGFKCGNFVFPILSVGYGQAKYTTKCFAENAGLQFRASGNETRKGLMLGVGSQMDSGRVFFRVDYRHYMFGQKNITVSVNGGDQKLTLKQAMKSNEFTLGVGIKV